MALGPKESELVVGVLTRLLQQHSEADVVFHIRPSANADSPLMEVAGRVFIDDQERCGYIAYVDPASAALQIELAQFLFNLSEQLAKSGID